MADDCYLWNAQGKADPSGFGEDYSFPYVTQVQSHFYGSSSNPLEPPSPIQWDMRTVVDASNPSAPTAYVNYNHTCYPAHQIKVNSTVVYSYIPPSNSATVIFNCLALVNAKVIGQTAATPVSPQ